MRKTINEKAWDGEWYMRALSKKENIGSRTSEGSKIYLNARTWAVLGDVVDEEKASEALLTSVDSMEHDFGFPLNMPPYEKYSPNVGRMSGMLPGLFENGGVYCHATGFKILMDCKLGRATKAISTLKKIMPDSEKKSVHTIRGRTICIYKLLFHTSEILRKVILVLDNRNFSLVYEWTI